MGEKKSCDDISEVVVNVRAPKIDKTAIPGAHVLCANKGVTALRPKEGSPPEGQAYGVWCSIALSIARSRDNAADLFIEDAGFWTQNDNPNDLKAFVEKHREAVVWSVVACGKLKPCSIRYF